MEAVHFIQSDKGSVMVRKQDYFSKMENSLRDRQRFPPDTSADNNLLIEKHIQVAPDTTDA